MEWIAKIFGKLVVEIDVDGTLSTYYRLGGKDYEVPYLLHEVTSYRL